MPPRGVEIVFVAPEASEYQQLEAHFRLDGTSLAVPDGSSPGQRYILFAGELPSGDHRLDVDLQYRRGEASFFSPQARAVVQVKGSADFHVQAGRPLRVVGRIEARADQDRRAPAFVAGISEGSALPVPMREAPPGEARPPATHGQGTTITASSAAHRTTPAPEATASSASSLTKTPSPPTPATASSTSSSSASALSAPSSSKAVVAPVATRETGASAKGAPSVKTGPLEAGLSPHRESGSEQGMGGKAPPVRHSKKAHAKVSPLARMRQHLRSTAGRSSKPAQNPKEDPAVARLRELLRKSATARPAP